jgi:nucleoside diphosphate kinase
MDNQAKTKNSYSNLNYERISRKNRELTNGVPKMSKQRNLIKVNAGRNVRLDGSQSSSKSPTSRMMQQIKAVKVVNNFTKNVASVEITNIKKKSQVLMGEIQKADAQMNAVRGDMTLSSRKSRYSFSEARNYQQEAKIYAEKTRTILLTGTKNARPN